MPSLPPPATLMARLFAGLLIVLVPAITQAAGNTPVQSGREIVVRDQLDIARVGKLDGSAGAPAVTLQRWRQAVFELQQGAGAELDWPQSRQIGQFVRAQMAVESDWHKIPMALIHARYDLEDESRQRRPKRLFAFSPLIDTVYYGNDFFLQLDSKQVLTHAAELPVAMWLDADDGLGFRSLQPGVPLAVSYSSTGTRTLGLKAQMPDGSLLEASAQLEVAQLVTPDPDDTWNVVASEPYGGVAGTGSAYVYLAEGHAMVTNPVVIVEGFDIDNSLGWPELYELLNRENLLEDLRTAGFDAVVLDFTEAVDPIQRNGLLLVELLQQVNAITAPEQSMVIVGASMGGLVSRYALLWMEQQEIVHRVRKLISFDAPHGGANIPLGMQAWIEFFSSQAAEADFLLQQLRSPASRQMLLYHLDSVSGTTANADPLLAQLNSEFTTLGGWPSGPKLVSIINGSGLMAGQSFDAGDQIIEWNHDELLASVDGDVWAVPDGGTQQIFDGLIRILISTTTDSLTVSDTLPWDNAPGGFRSTMAQAASVDTGGLGTIQALHDSHSFIPTVSSLALSTSNPFYDVNGDSNLLAHTPFDTVYYPAANQEHIEVTPENKLWFMAEVQAQIIVSVISNDTTEQGGTATFAVSAASAPVHPVTIGLSSSDPGEGSVPASVILPAGSTTPQLVTVTGEDDGDTDGSIAYSIVTAVSSSDDPAYNGINPADVAVVNLDDEPRAELIFEDGFENP